MEKRALILAYSQIRENEEADRHNQTIEAIYKAVSNLAKAMAGRKR